MSVSESTIEDNDRGGIGASDDAEMSVYDSLIANNDGNGTLAVDDAAVSINASTIADNTDDGIAVADSGVDVTVVRNNIVGNSDHGVVNAGTGDLNATQVWWGNESGPSGEGLGTGDSVSENVTFDPWLDAPFDEGNVVTDEFNVTVDADASDGSEDSEPDEDVFTSDDDLFIDGEVSNDLVEATMDEGREGTIQHVLVADGLTGGEEVLDDQTEHIVLGESVEVDFESPVPEEANDNDAKHVIRVEETDAEDTLELTVDNTDPTVESTTPEEDEEVEDVEQAVEFTVDDVISGIDAESIAVDLSDEFEGGKNLLDGAGTDDSAVTFDADAGKLTVDVTETSAGQFEGGEVDAEVSAADNAGNTASDDLTFLVDSLPVLEIEDFSDELPDGESEPADLEDVDVTVDETAGADATDVDVTVQVTDDDEAVVGDDEVTGQTIAAGDDEIFTFFEGDDSIDDLDADDSPYEVEVTVDADNIEPVDRTESFTVEETNEIATLSDLEDIDNDLSADYVVVNDIDADGQAIDPIAFFDNDDFEGTLDGNEYSITDLEINTGAGSSHGLFGSTGEDAVIENLYLEVTVEDADNTAGAFVGGVHEGELREVHATGEIIGDGGGNAGGLVSDNGGGSAPYGTVVDSRSDVVITGSFDDDVGGITAINREGTIENSFATGEIDSGADREGVSLPLTSAVR